MKTFTLRITLIALIAALLIPALPGALAQTGDACTFSTRLDNAALYAAPFSDITQQIGTLQPDVAYPVLASSGMHFRIQFDDATTGWADRRAGGISGDCDAIPVDDTPLTGYATLCTLTVAFDTPTYRDAALTVPEGALFPGIAYPVVRVNDGSLYLTLDTARGIWAAADAGTLSGACDDLPYGPDSGEAIVVTEANVWSDPDVTTGTIVDVVPAGRRVYLVSGPARGPIREDTGEIGDWYQITSDRSLPPAGWVWAGRLAFGGSSIPGGSLFTLPQTRLWSQPDVLAGEIVAEVEAGLPVTVLEGPVRGPVRQDTGAAGDWFRVTVDGLTGWVWSGRLGSSLPTEPAAPVTTLENARLWTQPDVTRGQVIVSPAAGETVTILSGPVSGPIRIDTDDRGDWYYVAVGDATGWIWAGRLSFN